jgi:ankyrin repeat protein
MANSDFVLRELVTAIVTGDGAGVSRFISASPDLATASFQAAGATRQDAKAYFLDSIARYINRGDVALHFAAAAYQAGMVWELLAAGANVRAKNRFGDEPLHAASVGQPGSLHWNPPAQVSTIATLIEAGADPNAADKRGVTPLHRAVRTRCAAAVRTLLGHGADPTRRNISGSTAMLLATMNTGRGGSGSPEAKEQQMEIVQLLEEQVQARQHSK